MVRMRNPDDFRFRALIEVNNFARCVEILFGLFRYGFEKELDPVVPCLGFLSTQSAEAGEVLVLMFFDVLRKIKNRTRQ